MHEGDALLLAGARRPARGGRGDRGGARPRDRATPPAGGSTSVTCRARGRSSWSGGRRPTGVRVTAEVTPHHLVFTDDDLVGYDTNFKVNPPLRNAGGSRGACARAVADGTIDVIATDHAPHAVEEKESEFDRSPPGTIGLETALAAVLTHLVAAGHRRRSPRAIEAMTADAGAHPRRRRPRRARSSRDAPRTSWCSIRRETWVVEPPFASKARNSAFLGRELTRPGRATRCSAATLTVADGKVALDGVGSPTARDGRAVLPPCSCSRTAAPSAAPRSAPRGIVRRGRVQHGHGRLPGGAHRPVVRGADRDDDLAAPGQLRHERATIRSRGAVQVAGFVVREASRRASSAGGPSTTLREDLARRRRRRHRGHRYPTAHAAAARARRRCAPASPPTDLDAGVAASSACARHRAWRAPTSPTACQRTAPYEAADARGAAPTHRSRARLPRRRLRLRPEAQHPAPAGGVRHRDDRLPGRDPAGRDRRGRLRRGVPVERTGRSVGDRATASHAATGAAGHGARSSASASGISCSGIALGGRTYKMPFGHRGVNQPVQEPARPACVEITSHNHGFAVDPDGWSARDGDGTGARIAAGSPSRTGTSTTARSRGCAASTCRPSACSTTRRPRRVRTTRATCSTSSARSWRVRLSRGAPAIARADAQAHRHPLDHGDRLGADRDRAGVRVRLLGHAGVQGAAPRGVPGRARELEPGHDHDRPRVRRSHLHRAAHARVGPRGLRARAARRAAADARRADGAQRRGRARRSRATSTGSASG